MSKYTPSVIKNNQIKENFIKNVRALIYKVKKEKSTHILLRKIFGEDGKPGYGLYDRALGCAYINGLFEGISKVKKERKWKRFSGMIFY